MDELKGKYNYIQKYLLKNGADNQYLNCLDDLYENTRTPEFPSPCTIEQYEEITGEKFPHGGMLWVKISEYPYWQINAYFEVQTNRYKGHLLVIVQIGQPVPDKNWRPE